MSLEKPWREVGGVLCPPLPPSPRSLSGGERRRRLSIVLEVASQAVFGEVK